MEDIGKEFGVILAAVLLAFGKEIIKWFKDRNSKEKDSFSDGLNYDLLINEELDRIKYTYGFNRVSIVNYHNGMESFDGVSFNYASMTHERVNKASSIIKDFQKIPVAPLADFLHELDQSEGGCVVIDQDNTDLGIVQEAWDSMRTYSFRLGTRISHGALLCTFTTRKSELNSESIMDCRGAAYKIKINIDKKKKL